MSIERTLFLVSVCLLIAAPMTASLSLWPGLIFLACSYLAYKLGI